MRISDWSSDVCSSDLAVPETVKKFIGLGAIMTVESGAGTTASVSDADYAAAGATIADRAAVLSDADIILAVPGPEPASLNGVKPGAWLIAGLNPFGERADRKSTRLNSRH